MHIILIVVSGHIITGFLNSGLGFLKRGFYPLHKFRDAFQFGLLLVWLEAHAWESSSVKKKR